MSIVVAIKSILLADTGFQAIGPTIYLLGSPINPDMPNITIHLVSGSDDMTHDGPDGLNMDMVRIFSKATVDQQTSAIAVAARKALNGYVGIVSGHRIQLITHRNRNSDHDTEAGIYRQIDDYRVAYSETS